MTFRAVIGAAAVATLLALSAAANPGVEGWILAGSKPSEYQIGTDPTAGQHRGPSAYIKSLKPDVAGFGTLMQSFSAEEYRGKRVRFSAAVRTQDVGGWAGLWMRVDGEKGKTLEFDNMQGRPIKGNTPWQRYEVVLDVPAEANLIALGILMTSSGQAWMEDAHVEAVSTSVPTTSSPSGLPKRPQNLDFKG